MRTDIWVQDSQFHSLNTRLPFRLFGRQSKVRNRCLTWPPIDAQRCCVSDFIKQNPDLVAPGNAMQFLSDDNGNTYNRCHCTYYAPLCVCMISHWNSTSVWSNFEIGDLDFWRGEAYSKFFDFLDEAGGFYYEVNFFFKCKFLKPDRMTIPG